MSGRKQNDDRVLSNGYRAILEPRVRVLETRVSEYWPIHAKHGCGSEELIKHAYDYIPLGARIFANRGMTVAEKLQRAWLDGDANEVKDRWKLKGKPRTLSVERVDWDWLVSFRRFRETTWRLREAAFNKAAMKELHKSLINLNLPDDEEVEFGHYTGPDDDLKSIYTNSRAIGYYGFDELGASVGRTRIYSVPKGTVKKTEDRLKGSVYSVSLFILDSYSFETRQELAYFRLPDRILPPQAFEPMPFMLGCNTDWFFATNALYRAYRNATGKGEDLIVFSCSPDILLEYPGEAVFFDFPLAQQ